MNNQLLIWRKSSTKEQWAELAQKSGTSSGYLNLIAYGHRNASPRLALAIETASKSFADKPVITKEQLVFKIAPEA
ncbi:MULTISPECIES: transcriptional regulator [Enterobacteriaceae]|uniref:transcriptional regulator n=1 Tax=Enterobacteriaceae TaxID=543 RepID=UPI000D6A119A|nr:MULTISPECIES: transcriptional regulator [Enterobacteriaceae]EAM8581035.1 transcriptional regulator [Salmonella enterica]EDQ3254013.1 transcriptional regulator [Salmonella enterica subsp. enterica serovar Farmsen]EAX5240215.1 transcriptional regulator [Salmonella enterica]EAX5294297.1 transcriptional regulator [Salmonella enterica]EAX5317749.1 transcriptional regulator [Salmonella enterica]